MKILEPDKNTGDLDTAAMYNEVKNVVNTNDDIATPLQVAYSTTVQADRIRFKAKHTMVGAVALTLDATGAIAGLGETIPFVGDGNNITISGGTIAPAQHATITTEAGVELLLVFVWSGSYWQVGIEGVNSAPPSPWTSFNGLTNHLKFGDIGDSFISAVGGAFNIEFEIRNFGITGGAVERFMYKFGTVGDQRSFSFYSIDADLYFQWYGDGVSDSRRIKWTGAFTKTTEQTVRVEYDGAVDTGDGLDRLKLYIDGVLIGAKTLDLQAGILSDIFNSTAELSFGTWVEADGTPGTDFFSGDARNLKITDINPGSGQFINVPNLSTGEDVSGNNNNGIWV